MKLFDCPLSHETAHYRRLKSNPLIKLQVRNGEAACIEAGCPCLRFAFPIAERRPAADI
jgi:hypothetical protein